VVSRRIPFHRVLGTVPGVRWLIASFIVVSFGCAVLVRIVAGDQFPTFGIALWWAVQTVTTVGYGDVTPTSVVGRSIAAVLMVVSVALVTLVTASISAAFVARMQQKRGFGDPRVLEAVDRLDKRLEAIEARLAELR
jgi:voltage-gated potassium channel